MDLNVCDNDWCYTRVDEQMCPDCYICDLLNTIDRLEAEIKALKSVQPGRPHTTPWLSKGALPTLLLTWFKHLVLVNHRINGRVATEVPNAGTTVQFLID